MHEQAPHLHHPRIRTLQRPATCTVHPRNLPAADDVCRALEQSAAENALPVEFFARVIWQESRFDARAVSPKGAKGIAQFMPSTASWHGFADPFDPLDSLRHTVARLRELLNRFGNLGLAAAAYNAGPARKSQLQARKRRIQYQDYRI
jgi:soluble lytic murein transglycosylase-like protein